MQAGDYRYFDSRFAALAHRGGYLSEQDRARENTLHAFSRAVAFGYRYLETDVHLSCDGVLFSFHDSTLERVSDGTGIPDELSWRELSGLRVAGRDPIPTLDELFEALPEARFNIDLVGTRPGQETERVGASDLQASEGRLIKQRDIVPGGQMLLTPVIKPETLAERAGKLPGRIGWIHQQWSFPAEPFTKNSSGSRVANMDR